MPQGPQAFSNVTFVDYISRQARTVGDAWEWLVGPRVPVTGPVVFLHIPKSAGTTLNAVINHQYPREAVYQIEPENQQANIERFEQLPQSRKDAIAVLRGHIGFGLHRHFSQPATYITVLRDPVERVISHYHYLRHAVRNGGDFTERPWLREAASMSLLDYARNARSADTRNGQTKLLAGEMHGWDTELDVPTDPERMLATAKQNLRDHIAVVGLTERFDESLILLRRKLGWRAPFYIKKNVTHAKPPRDKIPSDVITAIAEANQLDLELYRFANELFDEAVAAHGPSFHRELRWFRFMNARYGDVLRVEQSVRYRARRLARWRTGVTA